MPGLGGAVRSEQIPGRGRAEPRGQNGGGSGDETVGDNGHAAGGGSEEETAHGRYLEAANAAQNPQRTFEVTGVKSQGAPNGGTLSRQTGVVGPGAAAGHRFGDLTRDGRGYGTRRRGVSDAHLAKTQKVASGHSGIASELNAGIERGVHLSIRHGRTFTEVPGARGHAAADQLARKRERRRHADIADLQTNSSRARELVNAWP